MASSRFQPHDGSIERARALRLELTPAERRLWAVLRGRGLDNWKFRRQQRLGPFFADFCCQAGRLVIEVDGDTHVHAADRDARRTAFLEAEGYRVLRFTNADVMTNLDGVFAAIAGALDPSPSHPAAPGGPLPLPRGERG